MAAVSKGDNLFQLLDAMLCRATITSEILGDGNPPLDTEIRSRLTATVTVLEVNPDTDDLREREIDVECRYHEHSLEEYIVPDEEQ